MPDADTTLQTDRLLLRPWRVADAAFHRRLWLERDPRVPPHRRVSTDGRPTVADLEEWIRHYVPVPAPGLLVVQGRDSGAPLGYCGLVADGAAHPGEPELAFELLRSSWNRGLATEASQVLLEEARRLGWRHLVASVREWNGASLRVLEKLGFVRTGDVERDDGHGESVLLRASL